MQQTRAEDTHACKFVSILDNTNEGAGEDITLSESGMSR